MHNFSMENKLSCSVSVHEEEMDGKNVFVVECAELGISDFGGNINEALNNLKNGIHLLLEESPEKQELLVKKEPMMITRLFL